MYDYCLGGPHNSPADRAAVERVRAVAPEVALAAWANRGFHQRAAIWMAGQGIRQFLDLGCGLPAPASTREAVGKVCAGARVAYIDCDPLVIAHAQPLLAGSGDTAVMLADLRNPMALLTALSLDGLIDLAQPCGLLCTAVLDHVPADSDPHECLARLLSALAPGSYLALSHLTGDFLPPRATAALCGMCAGSRYLYPRGRDEVARFFAGLDLVPPYEGAEAALFRAGLWGAEDPQAADDDSSHWWWAGVARVPAGVSRLLLRRRAGCQAQRGCHRPGPAEAGPRPVRL
jgi:hypothetical protein